MKIATLGLLIDDDRVFLAEKKAGAEIGSGKLNGAGGKLEDGESLEKCLIRETEEEFGVTPTKFEKIGVVHFIAGGVPDFEVYVYNVTAWEGVPQETESMFPPQAFPITDLPYERMHDADLHWIDRAFSGEKFRANVYYRERGKDFERIEFLPFVE